MHAIVTDLYLSIVLSVVFNSFWYIVGKLTVDTIASTMVLSCLVAFGAYLMIDLHAYNVKQRYHNV